MTGFSEIRAAYGRYRAAKEQYWVELEQQAMELFNGFVAYLAPEPQSYKGFDGNMKPYIQAGKDDIGEFKPVTRPEQLDSRGNGLEMMIRVALDEDPDSFPKEVFTFQIDLKKVEGKYHIRLGGDASGRCIKVSAATGLESQTDVFEAMAAEILQFMNPSKFQ